MAAFSGFLHLIRKSSVTSSVLCSQFTSFRLSSTLTSLKLFASAKVIIDRNTRRSKGFGFVTYTTIEEAEKAKEGTNAKFLNGWVIFIDPAKPREPKPPL